MCSPNLFTGKAESASKAVIIFPPGWDVPIEKLLESGCGPGSSMHAVGDCFNQKLWKHAARNFAMLFRDAVDEIAEAQRQMRHVDGSAVARRVVQIREIC